MINRKQFLEMGALGLSGIFVSKTFGDENASLSVDRLSKQKDITFGLITDLHYDLMHDSDRRAQLFIDQMNKDKPDFIISLGDFCVPKPENKKLMEIWNQFKGDKHYVLGNHDTDGGFSKSQALEFWDKEEPYYSFDQNGFHFVILDGNEKVDNPKLTGYPRTIGKDQLNWLKEDLKNTKLHTIVFCHQGLENTINGLENGMEIRFLFEQINKEAGFKKVILVCTGHHHMNYHNNINGIHYVQFNSAAYYWAGEPFESRAFDDAFYKKQPILKRTLVYQDPIWASITIDHKKKITIKGKETVMAGVPLSQSGIDIYKDVYPISSKIDSRVLSY